MDCVKFLNVVSILGVPLFVSIYLIVELQPDFYKYQMDDPKKFKEAVIIAGIIQIILAILFTFWHYRRSTTKKQMRKIMEADHGNIQGSSDTLY